jgi:citrate lyase subunit beta/citryl-CoA lyase
MARDRILFMASRLRRSALYLPASNARAIDKARALACDMVILELEDAVAPQAKAHARALAVQAVRDGGFGDRELIIRCNGLDTAWGADDLAAAALAAPDAVLVPKIDGPADLAAYHAALADAPAQVALWVMIETCPAIFALEPIAAAGGRLAGLCLGLNDLSAAMGARLAPGRAAFAAILSLTVAAGRAHGISVLDGAFNALDDAVGLAEECRQGAEFGFDGKTVIHPSQIDICNHAFSPSPDRIAAARAVISAFADPGHEGQGALRVDGRMVEALHLRQAKALLAAAEAIAAREAAR